MPDILIEQALYGSQDAGGYRFLARSPGFLDDWLPEAERLCTGFGERPAGVACPRPSSPGRWARSTSPSSRSPTRAPTTPAGRGPRLPPAGAAAGRLRLPRRRPVRPRRALPAALGGARRTAGPRLARRAAAAPHRGRHSRSVRAPQAHQPTLLGGVQALVDGGRVVFERSSPTPTSSAACGRCCRQDAGHACGRRASPSATASASTRWWCRRRRASSSPTTSARSRPATTRRARYEHTLQVAAEAGDQAELDALFARRSRAEVRAPGLPAHAGRGRPDRRHELAVAQHAAPRAARRAGEDGTAAAGRLRPAQRRRSARR